MFFTKFNPSFSPLALVNNQVNLNAAARIEKEKEEDEEVRIENRHSMKCDTF